jgi:hypothetical protein
VVTTDHKDLFMHELVSICSPPWARSSNY